MTDLEMTTQATNGADRQPAEPTIVFDVGATWWRSALLVTDGLREATQRPAVSYWSRPDLSTLELQEHLVDYLIKEADRIADLCDEPGRTVGVCFGGAINAHDETVLQASQLWGPDSGAFPLQAVLSLRAPHRQWHVVNDITAHLLAQVSELAGQGLARVALLSVGTGIGLRTYDFEQDEVPIRARFGVQGEVGHLPIKFSLADQLRHAVCDCGGHDHLNAFVSGRGLEKLLGTLAAEDRTDLLRGPVLTPRAIRGRAGDSGRVLTEALKAGEVGAHTLLDAVTAPVADVVLQLLTYDAHVDRVLLTGGVVEALQPHYLDAVLRHCAEKGLYQITQRSDFSFSDMVQYLGDGQTGMKGAKLSAERPALRVGGNTWTAVGRREVRYHVRMVDGLFTDRLDRIIPDMDRGIRAYTSSARRIVVTDEAVKVLYGPALDDWLQAQGLEPSYWVAPTGEAAKTTDHVLALCRFFADSELARASEPVIAFGGGAVLDLVGFATGMYKRGTPYIRVPTTLLAMVDATVGVKTGVNFGGIKNCLGLYHPPRGALIDPAFLRTLDARQFASGIAEVIKIAVIAEADLFVRLESEFRDEQWLRDIIKLAVTAMMRELAPNLWERNLERVVDFGHTFSPVLETSSAYELLHGEAVTLDIAISVALAVVKRVLDADCGRRVIRLLRFYDLPVQHPLLTPSVLQTGIRASTVHRGGHLRMPLPTGIGSAVFAAQVSASEIQAAIAWLAGAALESVATSSRRGMDVP